MKGKKIFFIIAITFCFLNMDYHAYALEDVTDVNENIPATEQPITEQHTAAPTQAATQRQTQAATQRQTQAATQRQTQAATQRQTTQRQTQAVTQRQTTQKVTQEQTRDQEYETTEYKEWTTKYQQNHAQEDQTEITTEETATDETEDTTQDETTEAKKEDANSSVPWVPIIAMCCIAALIPICFAIIKATTKSKKRNASKRNAYAKKSTNNRTQRTRMTDYDNEDEDDFDSSAPTTEDLLDEDDSEYEDAPKKKRESAVVIPGNTKELAIDKLSYDFTMRVLPEVPKGSKNIEDAMDVIDGMDEAEIKNIILTPLFIPGKDNLEKAEIEEIVNEVIENSADDYGDIEFYWGHRACYNKMLYKAVRAGKVSTLANSRYLLVDFPEKTNLIDIEKCIVHLVDLGIRPIIAHVETLKDIDEIEECEDLINSGAYFMTDLSSYIGPKASYYKKHMENVFEHELVSFIESDSKFVVGTTAKIYKPLDWIDSICSEDYMYKMLVQNPEALLKNEEVDFKMV